MEEDIGRWRRVEEGGGGWKGWRRVEELSFSITVWFGRASQDEINQIESVVKYASKLIGLNMPSIRSLYLSRSLRKSKRIVQDEYHPANHLFELLPSGKRYRSIKTKTTRFNNSFYPQALRFLNGEPS